jgi:exosome complex component CSL4
MLSIKVLYINENKSRSGFSAIASAKVGGGGGRDRDGGYRGERRPRTIFRVGDIVRGRVVSLLNSTIHLTIAEKEFGVLYTLCFNCGGDTVRINDAIKCVECGMYEDRKLTHDYGKETLKTFYRASERNNSK